MDLAPVVRVALLDGFTLDTGETVRRAGDLLPHGVQRLVAHVSLARRSVRSVVAGQLWPEVPEGRAHGSLRSALWRVQKVAPGLLEVRGDMLALAAGVQVDVRELAAWAARVSDPAAPVDEFPAAHDRLTGELLPGWYDDWVLLERERLRQLRMHALERLADRLAAVRRYGRPSRRPTPRSSPSPCARAPTGRSSACTWRRATSAKRRGPSTRSAPCWPTSSASRPAAR